MATEDISNRLVGEPCPEWRRSTRRFSSTGRAFVRTRPNLLNFEMALSIRSNRRRGRAWQIH